MQNDINNTWKERNTKIEKDRMYIILSDQVSSLGTSVFHLSKNAEQFTRRHI